MLASAEPEPVPVPGTANAVAAIVSCAECYGNPDISQPDLAIFKCTASSYWDGDYCNSQCSNGAEDGPYAICTASGWKVHPAGCIIFPGGPNDYYMPPEDYLG